jgi:hypothetical protein
MNKSEKFTFLIMLRMAKCLSYYNSFNSAMGEFYRGSSTLIVHQEWKNLPSRPAIFAPLFLKKWKKEKPMLAHRKSTSSNLT